MTNKPIRLGYIKSLNLEKFYGWIESEEVDFFFHKSTFQGDWEKLARDWRSEENIGVMFENGYSSKGPRAENVIRIE